MPFKETGVRKQQVNLASMPWEPPVSPSRPPPLFPLPWCLSPSQGPAAGWVWEQEPPQNSHPCLQGAGGLLAQRGGAGGETVMGQGNGAPGGCSTPPSCSRHVTDFRANCPQYFDFWGTKQFCCSSNTGRSSPLAQSLSRDPPTATLPSVPLWGVGAVEVRKHRNIHLR